ncbi:MAG: type II toxin-antitoxin system VapC family toxin [Nitratireductor sp.]
MLDTNAVSHLLRFPEGAVATRLRKIGEHKIALSAIVASELRYGAQKRGSAHLHELVSGVLEMFPVLAYEDAASIEYASIRDGLTRAGELIGPVDMFIAAHARALGATLVTNNIREFSRVPELKLEDWTALP